MKVNITDDEKKDILSKAISTCRERELDVLFEEVCNELKRRGLECDVDLIESILDS